MGNKTEQKTMRQPITSIFDDEFVGKVNALSNLGDKRASDTLLITGVVAVVLLVIFKSTWVGAPLAGMDVWEFVAVVWVSALLIIFGTWMRLYQYRITREMRNNLIKAQVDIARFSYKSDERGDYPNKYD
ncbi:MAG: hypothetical protein J3T61_12355 [Candidatus Brocadiales bacterium]|nr:hypothetical protein [Candidatus Bathyanammoxibius sp.]